MVYKLGKQLYNKTTGVFAAAFFALAPWELILSRSFLIDTQCLFLSLIYLYFGVEAVRKNSVKLAAVSGVFFALALLTKLYAVFMLVPLLILYLYQRPKNTKQILRQVGAFSLPAVFFTLLWYQVIAGKDLLYLIRHNDFKDLNFTWYTPTYAFVPNFLVNYGLGIFFFVAFVFSLAIGLLFWKRFQTKIIVSDLVCLATILSVLGLVMFMAINLDLKAPYTSAIKYIYQSLPFFCLAAASLATKSSGLIQTAEKMVKSRRVIFGAIGVSGLILLISLVLSNIITAQWLSTINYVVLRVQPNLDYGYSFYIVNPTSQDSPQQLVQYFGFLLVLSGLLWTSRHFISRKLCQIRQSL
jgi:4-amino-4-deoxy-L-arabinose transferase-like glycosyltransferase